MIQIAVVSGKGGTGKTTLSAALNLLFENNVIADCDVDAPNLHLIFRPIIQQKYEYFGGKKAVIDYTKCTSCGVCEKFCRFNAIKHEEGKVTIDPYACEGCGVCVLKCPYSAVNLVSNKAGEYYVSMAGNRPMVHAKLQPGEETSGGLVAEVRKAALKFKESGRDIVVIDGAPGIGCPATSSITGATYVVIVTEPTASGFHDLQRIVETVRLYRRRFGVVINKSTINPERKEEIASYCKNENITILGEIPFDPIVNTATVNGVSILEYPESPAVYSIVEIFKNLKKELEI
ncbi:ATP-binding protein [Thermotoga sp. KOL6]|uniref:ATP-binding protein n=1 Tax=Thermotoga sp. KOL6 TaxID=126741 RepID=UPI000C77DE2F|nr:ATP-binding protein [Thermotoga sp. KOL6]PLV59082.1 (4Fe-4S)-binding protein [Thermotoga sp. KOL6]